MIKNTIDIHFKTYEKGLLQIEPKSSPLNDKIFIKSKSILDRYDNNGYQPTLDYCMELYRQDKISFTMKTELANMVTQQQMLPKRLRKWVRKIK